MATVGGTNDGYQTKKAAKKKPSTAWMDDHDDAHFSGNPAYRKPRSKKRAMPHVKDAGGVPLTKKKYAKNHLTEKTTKKRVAGK